jgi:hypothetical protein
MIPTELLLYSGDSVGGMMYLSRIKTKKLKRENYGQRA